MRGARLAVHRRRLGADEPEIFNHATRCVWIARDFMNWLDRINELVVGVAAGMIVRTTVLDCTHAFGKATTTRSAAKMVAINRLASLVRRFPPM